MSLFSTVVDKIEQNVALKLSGAYIGIPYPYPRLTEYVPSIDKESVIGITSYSGAGKSKFARHTYITHPYEFSIKNNYPILIDYYALEDSATKVYKNILCNFIWRTYKNRITLFDLDSKFKALSSDSLKQIKDMEVQMQDFATKVRIKDNFTHPYAIYHDVIKTAETLGTVEWKEVDYGKIKRQVTKFTPKDNTHWIILCDNLNNIDKEDHHETKKDAMDLFVQKDCRLLYAKMFKATCVIIHQQALEAERQQFTNTGGSIVNKIKPSLANLGGTKEVVRAYHILFSLFAPHKFKIPSHNGYDIERIGNNFRELEILKNNDGFDNITVPLYFEGASEYFKELPHSINQKAELDKFYTWLINERNVQKNKYLLF